MAAWPTVDGLVPTHTPGSHLSSTVRGASSSSSKACSLERARTGVAQGVTTPSRIDRHDKDRDDRVLGARVAREAEVARVASEVGRVVVGERVVRR